MNRMGRDGEEDIGERDGMGWDGMGWKGGHRRKEQDVTHGKMEEYMLVTKISPASTCAGKGRDYIVPGCPVVFGACFSTKLKEYMYEQTQLTKRTPLQICLLAVSGLALVLVAVLIQVSYEKRFPTLLVYPPLKPHVNT
jgi:hypothetical protein